MFVLGELMDEQQGPSKRQRSSQTPREAANKEILPAVAGTTFSTGHTTRRYTGAAVETKSPAHPAPGDGAGSRGGAAGAHSPACGVEGQFGPGGR